MGGFGDRVREGRLGRGWTLDALAAAAGCSKAYLSAIENGKLDNPPRRPIVDALERALNIPAGELRELAEWEQTPAQVRAKVAALIGQMNRADRRKDGAIDLDAMMRGIDREAWGGPLKRAAPGDVEMMFTAARQVPLINKVAAGYPTAFTDLDYPARVADEYVSAPGVTDPDAFAARVVGDSMLPDYRAGDVIVFSPATPAAEGSDCFVRLLPDHHTTFKRVYFEGEDRVRLQPLNPAFAAKVLSRETIDGLYPAVWRMQAIHPPPRRSEP